MNVHVRVEIIGHTERLAFVDPATYRGKVPQEIYVMQTNMCTHVLTLIQRCSDM